MNVHAKRPLRPETVTTGPIQGSRKVYATPAGHPAIRVPFREIALSKESGEPPLRVYDPSGPYTDSSFTPDLSAGLPSARAWLASRPNLETYEGRAIKPEDNGNVSADGLVPPCPANRLPRRGVGAGPVTQLEFARAGIITEEMIYVAHRENLGRERALENAAATVADGESGGGTGGTDGAGAHGSSSVGCSHRAPLRWEDPGRRLGPTCPDPRRSLGTPRMRRTPTASAEAAHELAPQRPRSLEDRRRLDRRRVRRCVVDRRVHAVVVVRHGRLRCRIAAAAASTLGSTP